MKERITIAIKDYVCLCIYKIVALVNGNASIIIILVSFMLNHNMKA